MAAKKRKSKAARNRIRIDKFLDRNPATTREVAEGLGLSMKESVTGLKSLIKSGMIKKYGKRGKMISTYVHRVDG